MICCPHCGKELDTTTCVNPLLNAAAGCQPTWQGTLVLNNAAATPVQFNQPPYINVCAAAGAANPGTFQIIKL